SPASEPGVSSPRGEAGGRVTAYVRMCLRRANCEMQVVGVRQPWRCLWRRLSQMTMTRPWRRITLHLSQIFLTLGLTFMGCEVLRVSAVTPRERGVVKIYL